MTELRKTITVWQGTALAVSMVIGSGLLGLPGIALAEGGVDATAVGWMLTALAAVPLIAIFSTLGLRFTTAAGLSRYAEAAAGRWARYAVAVVMVGSFPVGIPALAIIGGSYAQRLFGAPEWTVGWLAAGILSLVTAANLVGVRVAGYVNSASVVALVLVVAGTALARPADLGHGVEVTAQAATGGGDMDYLAVWTVCALLFWAYIGWENLSFGLEEFREPSRTIPRVYWASFALVVVLYVVLGLTTVGAQDRGLDLTGPSGLVTLVDQTPVGRLLVVVMVLVVLANANAWVFGASRLVFAAGRDGVLPRAFGRLSTRDVPAVSLLTLLAAYLAVIAIATAGNVSVTRLILIVSQNLIVLYAFSIVAYWKTTSGPRRTVVTVTAAVSWAFLLSGFSWWITYALLLLLLGWLRYRRHRTADREPSEPPAGEPVPQRAGAPVPEPTGTPTEAPAGAPAGERAEEPVPKRTGEPATTTTETPTRTPTGEHAGEPATTTTGTPTRAPAGERAGEPVPQPAGGPAGAPAPTTTGTPTRTPAGEPVPQPAGEAGRPAGAPVPKPAGAPAGERAGAPVPEAAGEVR